MTGILNSSALALMVSIGHQTGLFDTMSSLPPSTSQQIAQAADLQERYVREWLAAMTTGNIVDHDPVAGTYQLPAEHASFLTRAAGINNIASSTQTIGMLALVEESIVGCFKRGGGVPYSAYPKFQALMAEGSAQTFDAVLIDTVLSLVPEVVQALKQGIDVLDVGCGQGHAINLMAQAFPNSRFRGYDFSKQGIEAAQAEAQAMGLTNAHFETRDVAAFGDSNTYQFITAFDAIHDQAQPQTVLNQISEALQPSGTFLMVDVKGSSHVHENMDHPLAPYFYTVSTMHCMTVSLALDGDGLGTMWGKQKAVAMLDEAGFKSVEIKEVDGNTRLGIALGGQRYDEACPAFAGELGVKLAAV